MQDEEEGLSKEIETLKKKLNRNFRNKCLNTLNNSEESLINRCSGHRLPQPEGKLDKLDNSCNTKERSKI